MMRSIHLPPKRLGGAMIVLARGNGRGESVGTGRGGKENGSPD